MGGGGVGGRGGGGLTNKRIKKMIRRRPYEDANFTSCKRLSLAAKIPSDYRLAGLVVKASASGAEDPGFESRLRRDFSGSSHTSDFKIGTPVATLPGAWH